MAEDIIIAKNMTMRFGGLTAINDVSIHLKRGEILGLIGANGAGKTTLFNMISGILTPTAGVLEFQSKSLKKPKSHEMAKLGIGRTYQICQPFTNMTVLENTMVGALLRTSSTDIARRKSLEILEFVGIGEKSDIEGQDLTLPERKRMEVARALATEPSVLLLDEVMAGLNPTECERVIELIREIRNQGISIIIIEHVMRAIMNLSDRIYVLNQGVLIAEGSPLEISQDANVIKSYLGESRHVKN
jgi:ABC-type branched-subunit amino acid transport system ATPase component